MLSRLPPILPAFGLRFAGMDAAFVGSFPTFQLRQSRSKWNPPILMEFVNTTPIHEDRIIAAIEAGERRSTALWAQA